MYWVPVVLNGAVHAQDVATATFVLDVFDPTDLSTNNILCLDVFDPTDFSTNNIPGSGQSQDYFRRDFCGVA